MAPDVAAIKAYMVTRLQTSAANKMRPSGRLFIRTFQVVQVAPKYRNP